MSGLTDDKKFRNKIKLFFNDSDKDKIESLKNEYRKNACPSGCCKAEFSVKPFSQALAEQLPTLKRKDTANLIIMDQFGISEVVPDTVSELAQFSHTDIMFFISSSYIRRFQSVDSIKTRFNLGAVAKNIEYNSIHRYICEYFYSSLTASTEYYLAPFSIKKGGNIYGIIFGSGNLLGLEKFLNVCWSIDKISGEANYDIDDDKINHNKPYLFAELNVPNKIHIFKSELKNYISDNVPDNNKLYKYCLCKGFAIKKASEILREFQQNGCLKVRDIETNTLARKGSFYLNYSEYKTGVPKVLFEMKV